MNQNESNSTKIQTILSPKISNICQNKCILILRIQCSLTPACLLCVDWKYTKFTEAQIWTNRLLWTQELWIERCHENHRHSIFLGLSHNAWLWSRWQNWFSKRKGSDATACEAHFANLRRLTRLRSQQTAGMFLGSEWNWKFGKTGHVLPVFANYRMTNDLPGDHLQDVQTEQPLNPRSQGPVPRPMYRSQKSYNDSMMYYVYQCLICRLCGSSMLRSARTLSLIRQTSIP